jgi:hypothetical protein
MTNFDLAPPPVTVGGRTAVPIDISTVTGALRFDGATGTATGDVTIEFVVGPTTGSPIFDLRQSVTGGWLDGVSVTPAQIPTLDLGGGPGAELRVLDRVLAADSAHTLRLTYALGPPSSPAGGSYPPALVWSAGPRLRFTFGFTDLAAARYLESWLPANLIWDQYAIGLELIVTGTAVAHRPITNGAVTTLGVNHWRVDYPSRFTAFSPMLEIRATDTLVASTRAVTLPVSGSTVTIEAIRLASSPTVDLNAALTNLASWLPANELAIGRYLHADRFTAFLIQGGMEYDGGCTATAESLEHEAYHSWWGRGVKPAAQRDGWWDEAWNVYHDNGGAGVQPYDFTEPPVQLSPRNPYSRVTPSAAYSAGERFFAGAAALTSPAALTAWMGEFYRAHLDRPVTTEDLEAHLVARSGAVDLVDAFHRWVYGLGDPSPAPDLWLRDDPGHTGSERWDGRFWDSPDLWIRHRNDGGTSHQEPIAGRDNWFHARVRNRGAGTARHFLVTFAVKQFAGVQFSWPTDFLPAITAAAGFELKPGQERIVTARWPAAHVPPAGTHACWLAAVLTRSDRPVSGRHVWEHGNLAQKNLTVARGRPGATVLVRFVARGLGVGAPVGLEIRRPPQFPDLRARIVPVPQLPESPPDREPALDGPGAFDGGETAGQLLPLPAGPTALALLLKIPGEAPVGHRMTVDLVRLDDRQRVAGGVAVELVVT